MTLFIQLGFVPKNGQKWTLQKLKLPGGETVSSTQIFKPAQ